MTRPSSSSLEATGVTPYLVFLFAVLSTATLADGFDSAMLTVAAPDARQALGISLSECYGWTTNLFGRFTEVLVPLGVGLFVSTLGISWSVGVFAFGPVLGAIVVLLYAPETRGMTLEEIQDSLSSAEAPATDPSTDEDVPTPEAATR